MIVHVLGGFLGAGKTTLARSLAGRLRDQGERVAIVTNDQGSLLVDTQLCRDAGASLQEIRGGCFCCRYPELERALAAAVDSGATTAIAEAVGSCTDIVATVLAPLADRHSTRYEFAPYAVVVDPWRVLDVATGAVSNEIAYLFQKQIEEADVVLVSRADMAPPHVLDRVRAWQPHAPVVPVSGRTGKGIDEWLHCQPTHSAAPLTIDYDRYAAAEAQLGWFNGAVSVQHNKTLDQSAIMRRFLERLSDAPVAHVKMAVTTPGGGSGALVRRGAWQIVEAAAQTEDRYHIRWLVNARVALPPSELRTLLGDAMVAAAAPARVTWNDVECFSPARPVPTHRYAARRSTRGETSCCVAFYQREDVLRVLGHSLHPGGIALTRQVASALGLVRGQTVLDVACGTGASLRAILGDHPVSGIGLDAQAKPYADSRLELRTGDAHAIPLAAGSVDAVLCECALSTFVDQPGALREMLRVLRAGGRVAITDMVLEGDVPESLREWVHSGTCLQRALSARAYARALADAGFVEVTSWDASDALSELLLRIKRNLVGWVTASASGAAASMPRFDLRSAREALREAERAVNAGSIRYGVFIAQRPAHLV